MKREYTEAPAARSQAAGRVRAEGGMQQTGLRVFVRLSAARTAAQHDCNIAASAKHVPAAPSMCSLRDEGPRATQRVGAMVEAHQASG